MHTFKANILIFNLVEIVIVWHKESHISERFLEAEWMPIEVLSLFHMWKAM